tara:strand:- start:236 stop:445 length:210 start_codon:yes stop_codon:yes gene_type:complete
MFSKKVVDMWIANAVTEAIIKSGLYKDFLDFPTQRKIDKSNQYRNVRSKRMNKNRTLIVNPNNHEVDDL